MSDIFSLTDLIDTAAETYNNERNIEMQRETNRMSAEEAQKNRDYQERMSNTAYQRAREDKIKAGLNPLFDTPGASSPGGSQASFSSPASKSLGDVFSRRIQNNAQKALQAQQAANIGLTAAQTSNAKKEGEILQANKTAMDLAMHEKKAYGDFYKKYGERAVIADKTINALQGLLGLGTSALGISGMIKGLGKSNKGSRTEHYNSDGQITGGTLTIPNN